MVCVCVCVCGGGGGGVAPKRNVFLGRTVANPTIKKSKTFLLNKINSAVTHALYHFCDMSLKTAYAIFCSLEFHIVCAHMYFLWRHHFPPDKSENDQDNDSIDLHIVLTYDC